MGYFRYDLRASLQIPSTMTHLRPDSLLPSIKAFLRLKHLEVIFFDVSRSESLETSIRDLQSVLDAVHSGSGSALQSLQLHITCEDRYPNYSVDRMGLLDLLLGEEMVATLSKFSCLRQLNVTLVDNDEEFDDRWWSEEMASRLPGHIAVEVDVKYDHGTSCNVVRDAVCDK